MERPERLLHTTRRRWTLKGPNRVSVPSVRWKMLSFRLTTPGMFQYSVKVRSRPYPLLDVV